MLRSRAFLWCVRFRVLDDRWSLLGLIGRMTGPRDWLNWLMSQPTFPCWFFLVECPRSGSHRLAAHSHWVCGFDIYIYIYMYLLIRGEFILAQWYSKVVTCPVGPTPGATAARTTVRGPTPLILSTVEALNKPHPYLIVIKRVLPLSYWHDPVWIRLGFQTWGVFVRFSSGVSLIHASGMERIHYSDPSFNGSILLEPVSVRIHWPYVLINLTREIIDWFCFWGSQRW